MQKFGQGSIGFPFTVFTDRQQRIVLFHLGELDQAKADVLLGVVRQVNRGELTPAAARVVAAKQLEALPPDRRLSASAISRRRQRLARHQRG